MAEAAYQSKLKKALEAQGWTVLKLARLTVNGYPDLIACHPERSPVFIEVKAEGGRTSKIQDYRINELRGKGFQVLVAYPSDFEAVCTALRIPPPEK